MRSNCAGLSQSRLKPVGNNQEFWIWKYWEKSSLHEQPLHSSSHHSITTVDVKFLRQNSYMFQSYLKIFRVHISQSCSMLKSETHVNLPHYWITWFPSLSSFQLIKLNNWPVLCMSLQKVTSLGWNLASVTDLKEFKLHTVYAVISEAIKPLQLVGQPGQVAELKSLSPSLSPCRSSGNFSKSSSRL